MKGPGVPRAEDANRVEQESAVLSARINRTMAPPGSEFYRSGLWQVVVGPGVASRKLADLVATQCRGRQVDVVVTPVDEIEFDKLYRYTGLVLVLEPTDSVESFIEIFTAYRLLRADGLASVLTATRRMHEAGPIQVVLVGSLEDCQHPGMLPLRQACVTRVLPDSESLVNLFDVYDNHRAAASSPDDGLVQGAAEQWRYLQSWNVPSLADVAIIKRIIDNRIQHYNDGLFHKTSNPLPGISKLNRLELVLLAPELRPLASAGISGKQHARALKNFTESGARVVRDTLKAIQRAYPPLARPGGRSNTKDNQQDFQRFYDALLVISKLPEELRDRIPRS